MDEGMVIDVSALQPENALAPILVMVEGKLMDVSPTHPAKALSRTVFTVKVSPPNVTVLGMVMAPEATAATVLETETDAVSWSTMR